MLNVISCAKEHDRYHAVSDYIERSYTPPREQQEKMMDLFNDVINLSFPVIASWRKELQK